MALELKQNLKLSQQLVMTPQLQRAIKRLQLSRLELVALIRTEMEQNPLLEEPAEGATAEIEEAPAEMTSTLNESIEASELLPDKPPERENDAKQQADGEIQRTDIDWEQYLDNYQTQHTAPSGGSGGARRMRPAHRAGGGSGYLGGDCGEGPPSHPAVRPGGVRRSRPARVPARPGPLVPHRRRGQGRSRRRPVARHHRQAPQVG